MFRVSWSTFVICISFIIILLTNGLNYPVINGQHIIIHASTILLIALNFAMLIINLYTGKIYLSKTIMIFLSGWMLFLCQSLFYTITDYSIYRLSATLTFLFLIMTLFQLSTIKVTPEKMSIFCRYSLLLVIASTLLKEIALAANLASNQTVYGTNSFYLIGLGLTYYYFFSKQKFKDKCLLSLTLFFTLYSFSINFQRGAFIFNAVTAFLIVFIKRKSESTGKTIVKTVITVVIMACFFVTFGGSDVQDKFLNANYDMIGVRDVRTEDGSTLYRAYVYYMTFEELTKRWDYTLFGKGFGRMETRLDGETPHSTILGMLLATGLMGILWYYWFIGTSLKRCFQYVNQRSYHPELYQFAFVYTLSNTIYSGFNNANGLSWELMSVTTNLFYFIVILIPFITTELNQASVVSSQTIIEQ